MKLRIKPYLIRRQHGSVIDERIMIGTLGAKEITGGGVELGFWLPCTTTEAGGGSGGRCFGLKRALMITLMN
jgi:hypothetical protein